MIRLTIVLKYTRVESMQTREERKMKAAQATIT